MKYRFGSFLAIGALIAVAACDNPAPTAAKTEQAVSVSNSMASLKGAPACAFQNGFNEFGYNYCARIFNGTGSSWAAAYADKKGVDVPDMGVYGPDKLIMKWNAAWDACNLDPTETNCTGAWTDNEWNGMVKGGSGSVWHYKIKWIGGDCGADYTPLTDGGYCVWGSYETTMDQGKDPNLDSGPGHLWFAHAKPNGYGN